MPVVVTDAGDAEVPARIEAHVQVEKVIRHRTPARLGEPDRRHRDVAGGQHQHAGKDERDPRRAHRIPAGEAAEPSTDA